MKHIDYFGNFLTQTVNLSKFNLETLEGRAEAIYRALKADPVLGPMIIKMIPQGSWAQKTIISPQNGKPFDADFLLQMRENPDWAFDVQQYINAVYLVIRNHSIYGNMPHGRKCRCVYVEYAENKMHVDIVPFVILSNGRQVIVNRDDNQWETTNPGGFTDWMTTKDAISGRTLREVIRLLKFLRDHRNSFTGTKSILMTTLLGEQVTEVKKILNPGYYSDLPTALLNMIQDLDAYLQMNWIKPSVADPSGTGTTFDHRWTQETYAYFRDRIHAHAQEIHDAYHETDEAESVRKWQALFGDGFKAPTTPSSSSNRFSEAAGGAAAAAGGGGAAGTSSAGRSGRAG